MRGFLYSYGLGIAAWVPAGVLVPLKGVNAAPRYTQYAQQCVRPQNLPAGYYKTPGTFAQSYAPYPFTRFYNTCNVTISLMLTTDGYGNNGPGAPGPGAFMVMNWPDGTPKDVHSYACVWPGRPVKTGSTFVNPPSYHDAGYQCLVP